MYLISDLPCYNADFTLGRAFQDQCKQTMINNIQINITRLKIPTGGRQTSWLFTSIAEKLNSGLQWTTSARGQNGIWTCDLRISNPALQPLGHVAFCSVSESTLPKRHWRERKEMIKVLLHCASKFSKLICAVIVVRRFDVANMIIKAVWMLISGKI